MVMFNKKYFVTFLILLTFYTFFNLFSDVKVEFLSLSLVEYKEFSLNCGNVYQILFEGVEYSDKKGKIYTIFGLNKAKISAIKPSVKKILTSIKN